MAVWMLSVCMGNSLQENGRAELFSSGLILQVVLKKSQLQSVQATVPVEVGPGTNSQQRRATSSASTLKEIQDAA